MAVKPVFQRQKCPTNGKNTRPNGKNTRPRRLTISHNGIYLQELRFSARTATTQMFLSSGKNKYHMEDPCIVPRITPGREWS